jgi:hypothetical protein
VRRKKLLALRHLRLRVVIFVLLTKRFNTDVKEFARMQRSKKGEELAILVLFVAHRQSQMKKVVSLAGSVKIVPDATIAILGAIRKILKIVKPGKVVEAKNGAIQKTNVNVLENVWKCRKIRDTMITQNIRKIPLTLRKAKIKIISFCQ